jgi:hypothetical protein
MRIADFRNITLQPREPIRGGSAVSGDLQGRLAHQPAGGAAGSTHGVAAAMGKGADPAGMRPPAKAGTAAAAAFLRNRGLDGDRQVRPGQMAAPAGVPTARPELFAADFTQSVAAQGAPRASGPGGCCRVLEPDGVGRPPVPLNAAIIEMEAYFRTSSFL